MFAVTVGPKVLRGGERAATPGPSQREEESVILSVSVGRQRQTPSALRALLLPPGWRRPGQSFSASLGFPCYTASGGNSPLW